MDQIRREIDVMEADEQKLSERQGRSSTKVIALRSSSTHWQWPSLPAVMAAVASIRRELQGRIEANRQANAQKEGLLITLKSIGDAVIVTDAVGPSRS